MLQVRIEKPLLKTIKLNTAPSFRPYKHLLIRTFYLLQHVYDI